MWIIYTFMQYKNYFCVYKKNILVQRGIYIKIPKYKCESFWVICKL